MYQRARVPKDLMALLVFILQHLTLAYISSILSSMKVKTSITLSEDLIQSIDSFSGGQRNRSDLIEKALRDYLDRQARMKRDLEDLAILNKKADKLNREAEDVLSYQADV
jgi:Arc/MetJ-type ribon-helix-helix transcriptional regulator